VAWRALSAVFPELGQRVGGIETGAWTLARGLALEGRVDPLLVMSDPRSAPADAVAGVRLQLHRDRLAAVRLAVSEQLEITRSPRLRIRLKRFTPHLFWQVPLLVASWPWRTQAPGLTEPDPRIAPETADVWGTFGVSGASARVIAAADRAQRPSLLFLESNADLDPRWSTDPGYVNPYGETSAAARYCLDRATQVVCQSQWQQARLRERFHREGVLIRNPIDLSEWRKAERSTSDYVLWIGRWDQFHKRPQRAFDIARCCPEIPFLMVVNPHDHQIEASLRAELPANIKLRDYVPFSQMPAVFGNARIFLSTSSADYEGFPNVLLQAAASGTPIVSQEDFDHFLQLSGAGPVVGPDPRAAGESIRKLWASTSKPKPTVDAYLAAHHALASVARQVADLAIQCLRRDPPVSSG
jgi:glycosyltransferase involved in cell wall biosynthesis